MLRIFAEFNGGLYFDLRPTFSVSGRRTGAHVIQHFHRSPFELYLEIIDRNLRHRQRDATVIALDNESLRWPEGFNLSEYILDDLVAFTVHSATLIGPDGKRPPRFQDALSQARSCSLQSVARKENSDSG